MIFLVLLEVLYRRNTSKSAKIRDYLNQIVIWFWPPNKCQNQWKHAIIVYTNQILVEKKIKQTVNIAQWPEYDKNFANLSWRMSAFRGFSDIDLQEGKWYDLIWTRVEFYLDVYFLFRSFMIYIVIMRALVIIWLKWKLWLCHELLTNRSLIPTMSCNTNTIS